ncbi:hypothetical protein [Bacillus paralicheniformis]|uniref:hypothetical protein n=1 Tax=Bacillus paralicheniformis TaxID=1648923 RepID=UPI001FD37C9F|nr:hypothetical protein [Bacillus paralicheniformis]
MKMKHIQEPLQTAGLLGKMVWKSGPRLMICMVIFMLIEAGAPLIQLYASKQMIDGIVEQEAVIYAEIWAVIYAGSLVMISVVKSLEKWVKAMLSERSMITVNSLLIDAFERIPGMRFFEDPKYRDRLETLRDRSTWLPSQFINISSNLVTAVMSLAGVVLIIAYLSPVLAVILIFSTAPFAFVHNHYNEMEWEYHKDYAPVRRRAAYARHILLGRRSAKEVRLFGLGSFFLDLYQSAFKGLYSVLRNIQVRSARWSVLTGFLSGRERVWGTFGSCPNPIQTVFLWGYIVVLGGRVPIINGSPGYRQGRCRYVGYMENGKRLFSFYERRKGYQASFQWRISRGRRTAGSRIQKCHLPLSFQRSGCRLPGK